MPVEVEEVGEDGQRIHIALRRTYSKCDEPGRAAMRQALQDSNVFAIKGCRACRPPGIVHQQVPDR